MTLQEVDDLVAHRPVLVGGTGAGGEQQLPCAEEACLELRMREDRFPVGVGAFMPHDVGCMSPCERADRHRILTGSVGGLNSQDQVAVADAVGGTGAFMPDTSGSPEMVVQILQNGEAVFVNAVAAVHLGLPHLTEEGAELLTLGEDLEWEVCGL